ncbi:MAG: hypothetical protein HS099_05355 [Ardenticatenaceae bacterium]|nr:hypothetical protein [Ardenticatenaceae bacterium]
MQKLLTAFGNLSSNTEREILKQWNKLGRFPAIPPADFGYARARLTVFRSNIEWLTVFEIVGYASKAGECLNVLHAHGNKLSSKRSLHFLEIMKPSKNSANYPNFDEDEAGNILLDPLDFTVVIGDREYHYTPTSEDYLKLGISLKHKSAGEIDAIVKILRWLSYEHSEKVFLGHLQMLKLFARPEALPLFLQTYEWQHPDFRKHEKPSDLLCFRNLAKALALNDSSLYKCPEQFFNTHWSFWPEWPN